MMILIIVMIAFLMIAKLLNGDRKETNSLIAEKHNNE